MSKGAQIITCKAVVCWGIGEPVKVEEIQVDPPKSSEVRVKILYASVCHTDILYTKGFPIPLFPRVLGHEGVGMVESLGDEVTDLKEGDIVIPTFLGECQECENCLSRKTNLCLKYPVPTGGLMPDDTSRMTVKGKKLYHTFTCSTWSEYMVVDTNYVVKLDPSISLPHASFISCGFSTGLGGAWKEAQVEKGSTVVVLGLGAVGLGAIEGARIQGAAKIIGIDTNDRKRIKGKAFGMTDFINPNEYDKSISELVKELTGGLGVDYCFECTGVPPLVNEALQATKMGKGETIVIGAGSDPTIQINLLPLLFGGNLRGSIFGGLKAKTDFPIVVEKCKNK
ncbi:alcohol dehydrogenase-like 1 isoform X1, partial [Fagus crenata]